MYVPFIPFKIKIKKNTLEKRKELKNFSVDKSYDVICVEIINEKTKFEKLINRRYINKETVSPGTVEIDDEEDEDEEIVEIKNVMQTEIYFLVGNQKSGEFIWFDSNETKFSGRIDRFLNCKKI